MRTQREVRSVAWVIGKPMKHREHGAAILLVSLLTGTILGELRVGLSVASVSGSESRVRVTVENTLTVDFEAVGFRVPMEFSGAAAKQLEVVEHIPFAPFGTINGASIQVMDNGQLLAPPLELGDNGGKIELNGFGFGDSFTLGAGVTTEILELRLNSPFAGVLNASIVVDGYSSDPVLGFDDLFFQFNPGALSTTSSTVQLTLGDLPGGDFNGDTHWDCLDVDALVAEIVAGTDGAAFDLTADGAVNQDDLAAWLTAAGQANLPSGNPYLVGDANLSGAVDITDFNIWNSHKFTTTPGWCQGDFNADGVIDLSDFNQWNSSKFNSSARAVPESSSFVLNVGVFGVLVASGSAGRRTRGQTASRLGGETRR